ncbi:MAG: hypothetical protein ACK4UY_03970 [Dietzia sp.]
MTDPQARLADAWWASLPPGRQAQIFRWIAGREAALDHPQIAGQLDLLDDLPRTG